jgi:hypothetical protein
VERDAIVLTSTRCRSAAAIVALLLAAVIAKSAVARVLAKAVLDPLLHSTSAGAAMFALLFIAASLAALAWRSDVPISAATAAVGRLLLAALVVGNVANVAGHLAAMRALHLSPRVAIYSWAGNENTYSYLFHSHAGKEAITRLLQPVANALGLDVGQAWAGLVPAWVGWVCGLSLAAALAAYLYLLPGIARRFNSHPWIRWLFGLAAINAIKTIVDGGLLSYRCLPSLLVIATLALARDAAQLRRHARIIGVAAGLVFLGYFTAWRIVAPVGCDEALRSLVLVILSLGLPLWAALPFSASNPRLRRSGVIALGSCLCAMWVVDASTAMSAQFSPLPVGYTALRIDGRDFSVREVAAAGRSAFQVYRGFGEDPLKPARVLLLNRSAATAAVSFPFLVIARTTGVTHTTRAPPWTLAAVTSPSPRVDARLVVLATNSAAMRGAFSVAPALQRNNYYSLLHGLATQLAAGGLENFVVVPLRDRADFASLR